MHGRGGEKAGLRGAGSQAPAPHARATRPWVDRSSLAGSRHEAECRESVLGAGGREPAESRAGRPWTTRPRGPHPALGGIQARLWLLVGPARQPGRASVCVGTGAVNGARPELVEPRLRIPFTFCSREGPGQPAGGLGTVPAEMQEGPQPVATFLSPLSTKSSGPNRPDKIDTASQTRPLLLGIFGRSKCIFFSEDHPKNILFKYSGLGLVLAARHWVDGGDQRPHTEKTGSLALV